MGLEALDLFRERAQTLLALHRTGALTQREYEDAYLALVNEARASFGFPPLYRVSITAATDAMARLGLG